MHSCRQYYVMTLLVGQTLLLFVVCCKQLFSEFCSKMASESRSKKAGVYLQKFFHIQKCDINNNKCFNLEIRNISVLCPKVKPKQQLAYIVKTPFPAVWLENTAIRLENCVRLEDPVVMS